MRALVKGIEYRRRFIPLLVSQSGQVPLSHVYTGLDISVTADLILTNEEMDSAGFTSTQDMANRIGEAIEKAFEPSPTGQKTSPAVITEIGRRRIDL
jgi:hypothetical protein